MKKEKAELIQEALDTLQAVTLSWMSTDGYVAELFEYIRNLEEENKKLKSDLSECECSMHFENDEVWFWKREYKRLKKWIKDHCKWYWNLFPEDEMKRQRKKADKKRK